MSSLRPITHALTQRQVQRQQGMQSDYAAAPANNANANGGANPDWAHLPVMQRKIMELVSKDVTDEGMHVSAISRTVGAGKGELAV